MDTNVKILITGGTGYLGSHLTEYLADQGYNVTALGRKEFIFKNKNINLLSKDVRELIFEDLQGFSHIFHLAAISPNNKNNGVDEAEIYRQNVESTLHLLELIKNKSSSTKLIFSSSAGVYGRGSKRFSESCSFNPIDLYSCSKASCEQLIKVYAHKNSNIKPLILRIANIYGPGQKLGFVIPDTIARINQSDSGLDGEIAVFNGQSVRDFIYIDDLIAAISMALEKELTGTYNIGTGKPTLIIELASQLIRISKKQLVIKEENKNQDVNVLNISKIKKEGWTPQPSLKKGLKETYKSYLNN
ncbi:MAG: NAD(P)-dependent oxidoreductase [Nanoarchaeota archaeon]|mgnify:CR=1 FL=1